MVYRIKFICEEADGFVREVEIDSEASFLDLSNVILSSCGYQDDQMTSFYVCDDEWERGVQITREDVASPEDDDIYLMEKTRLTDFVEDEGQKLEYVFDPFAERSFSLVVKEVKPGEHLERPVVVRTKGDAPEQIQSGFGDDAFVAAAGKGAAGGVGLDDDYSAYGLESSYNDDEIDFEGFEISDTPAY